MSDEVCSLFDGINPGYKIPDFISSGMDYAQKSFDELYQAATKTFNNVFGSKATLANNNSPNGSNMP